MKHFFKTFLHESCALYKIMQPNVLHFFNTLLISCVKLGHPTARYKTSQNTLRGVGGGGGGSIAGPWTNVPGDKICRNTGLRTRALPSAIADAHRHAYTAWGRHILVIKRLIWFPIAHRIYPSEFYDMSSRMTNSSIFLLINLVIDGDNTCCPG